jgi:hypothetical protein
LNRIDVPRNRICRRALDHAVALAALGVTTLPVGDLKRFCAPDLVFNLGIWLSLRLDAF